MKKNTTKSKWEKLQSIYRKRVKKAFHPDRGLLSMEGLQADSHRMPQGSVSNDMHISSRLLIQTTFHSSCGSFVVVYGFSQLPLSGFHSTPGRALNICSENKHFFFRIVKNHIPRKKFDIVETGPASHCTLKQ